MTTATYSTIMPTRNDAELRAYGSELNGWLAAIGLVQTADTGQINWTTVTTSTVAGTILGYEIWRFADSSIYFKLEFSTNTNTTNSGLNILSFFLTVGEGSNGSGTITGTSFPRTQIQSATGGPASVVATYPTYICRTADFFGIIHKQGGPVAGVTPCHLGFAIEKHYDDAGVVNTGFTVTWTTGNATALSNKRTVRTATPARVYAANTSFTVVPGAVTSSTVGADVQCWGHYYPEAPVPALSEFFLTIIASEKAPLATFTLALRGTTHTYMSIGNYLGTGFGSSATWTIAMLWE